VTFELQGCEFNEKIGVVTYKVVSTPFSPLKNVCSILYDVLSKSYNFSKKEGEFYLLRVYCISL